jgi:hypothetical protein
MEIFGKNVAELIGLTDKQGDAPVEQTPEQAPEQREETPQETGGTLLGKDGGESSGMTAQQAEDPFKALLEDGFVKQFLDSYVGNDENIEDLLQQELERVRLAKTDFSAMADTDIIRAGLKKEWPELQGAAFEKAVKKYFEATFGEEVETFEDDEDSVSEKQVRDAQIRRKANEYRKQFQEEQAKSKRKTAQEIKAEKEAKDAEARQKAQSEAEAWDKMVKGNGFVSKALESGEIKVGKADQELSYRIKDKDKFTAALTSDPDFFNLFATNDTKNPVDFQRWAKVVAYALDPEGFEALLYSSGKNAATGKIMDELENPAKPGEVRPSSPNSFAESLMGAINKKR